MACKEKLVRIFDACQDGGQADLLTAIIFLQQKVPTEEFWDDFCFCLMRFLIVGEKHVEVDRGLDFIAKFATSCDAKLKEGETDKTSFLMRLWDFLLKHHQVKSPAIRMRICQLTAQLLKTMSDEATIDDQVFDSICKTMLERIEDKVASVRAQAAHALLRLQDPSSEHCLVIKAYLFHLEKDPSADVRKAILANIAASKQTLTAAFCRTRDIEGSVRAAAFLFLAEKVHYRYLSIANRVQLLHEGLRDRSDMVKNVVKRRLLPSWLKRCNHSPLVLLTILDVENASEEAQLVMQTYFESNSLKDIVIDFTAKIPIPITELTCEKSFYWRCLCQHVHSLGVEGDDLLEKLLLDLPPLCDYIRGYVEQLPNASVDELLEQEFVVHQLVVIAGLHDTLDECGRKSLLSLIQWLLLRARTSTRLVEPLVDNLAVILTSQDSLTTFILEVIAEIRDPIAEIEAIAGDEERRRQELQLAKVRVQLNEVREQLNICINRQDFVSAAEIKARITELEKEKDILSKPPTPPPQETTRIFNNDSAVLLKCLAIASALLRLAEVKTLSPGLQTLVETLVLPGVQNGDVAVRTQAIKTLGLACLLSRELAELHLVLLLEVLRMDQEEARLAAAKALMDLLLAFGLDLCGTPDANGSSSKGDSDFGDEDDASAIIIQRFTDILDNETSEVRTLVAEGLGKLLFCNRLGSTKLLSRLIVMYFNPVTEDDTYLRHFLGVFLAAYASATREHLEFVEEAFLPTLRTLLQAPTSSPLAGIDAHNVAKFMVELTRERRLADRRHASKGGITIHQSLAIRICNEILSDPKVFYVRVFAKALSQLDVTDCDETQAKDLSQLTSQIVKNCTDQTSLKPLEKFQGSIFDLLKKFAGSPESDVVFREPVSVAPRKRSTAHHAKQLRRKDDTTLLVYSSGSDAN